MVYQKYSLQVMNKGQAPRVTFPAHLKDIGHMVKIGEISLFEGLLHHELRAQPLFYMSISGHICKDFLQEK